MRRVDRCTDALHYEESERQEQNRCHESWNISSHNDCLSNMYNEMKREYHEDPIKEYIKYKKAEKNLSASMMKAFGFIALVGILIFVLVFYL